MSTALGTEVIAALEMLVVVEQKRREINEGKLIIGLDNRKSHRGIVENIEKMSLNVHDVGVESQI